ncbi:MAG: discoidin domain-containing protein [Lewinellaceae bacterium]|nr:discoidin domain-containing protein [Phaeodactylibacter sp.]MCB9035042.1 discoidin domain-containing protein [Lewinellaceae bacterium]
MATFRYHFLLLNALLLPFISHSQCFDQNISQGKPVMVSSTLSGSPSSIVDGNVGTQWVSERSDPQWAYVDLGIVHNICALTLQWDETFFASGFEIQTSDNAEDWETRQAFVDNAFPEFLLDELDWNGRYVRIYAQQRANINEGFILREFTLYGGIEAPYQVLSFPPLPDRLSTDEPFELQASATSGLPVSFSIASGPASVAGNLLTLTGEGGTVVVRAIQEGNGDYFATEPIERSFEAINPAGVFPEAIITSPGTAYPVAMPQLGQIALGARGRIAYPQWFSIESVEMELDGQPVQAAAGADGHIFAYWTPENYGMHTLTAKVTASNGNASETAIAFEVAANAGDVALRTFDRDEIIAFVNSSVASHYQMPSNLGAFSKITATLNISCPGIGCDAWDRLAHVEVRTPEGEWVEFIRYITPYGIECEHIVDVTDYAALLQGNPEMRVRIGTFQRGWAVTLDLDYEAGAAPFRYSKVERLWYGYHAFGDPANRQPADTFLVNILPEVQAAKLHLVGTGHGWGENNSLNAAEFYNATHHILVNGQETFEHHNWTQCDPNPDGCSPQNGTWQFNRAGWCPGAISPFFEYDMSPYIGQGQQELFYRMYPNYVDLCHPNNPNCVSGATCPNCNDGFNPHLVLATNLITFSNQPIGQNVLTATREKRFEPEVSEGFALYPNPTDGRFTVEQKAWYRNVRLRLFSPSGQLVYDSGGHSGWPGLLLPVDLSGKPAGLYHLAITTEAGTAVKRVVVR